MYSDGIPSKLWTGELVEVEPNVFEYEYPSARQNAVIVFSGFYLSAIDGDFTTDGLAIMTQTGQSTDITIGNAPSAVLTATMLNPEGLMEKLTWGDGTAYIGVVTASAAADIYNSRPCHVYVNSVHYSISATGICYRGTTNLGTLGGSPLAIISNSDGSDVYFITTTKMGRRVGGTFSVITPDDAQKFLASHFANYEDAPIGIALDANGCPSVLNNVTENTKVTYSYVPMGAFDFRNVDAFGSTFTVEAYDKMTVFDADGTDWINNLSFAGGKTVPQVIDALIASKFNMGYVIDGNAVNTSSIVWSANPVTSYSVTYRQLIAWLAEAIGCNVRMGRDGRVEFYVFNPTSVAAFTPNIVVNGTRTKGKTPVPAITQVICYNALGAGYTSTGSAGSNYYIVANPFIDPSGDLTPINNIKGLVDDIPTYYATNISIACYDPHIDIGDFLTIEDREGGGTYDIPIMASTLHWAGMCNAELAATGNQVRAIPSSMENSDLASVVDSNPSAVVNKIQAVGISADWITTGRLTVKDASNNVLFDANISSNSVQIGGFDVNDYSLSYTTASVEAAIENGQINLTDKTTQETASILPGYFEAENSGGTESSIMTPSVFQVGDSSTSRKSYMSADNIYVSDGANDFITYMHPYYFQAIDNNDSESSELSSSSLTIDTSTMTTELGSGLKQTSKSTGEYTSLGYRQLIFCDGTLTTGLRALHLVHNSGGTAETSYTITLPTGVYLLLHAKYNQPTAAATGAQLAVIGSSSGAASVVTTLSGSGTDITATTGTRSQVTIGTTDGDQATLTWTVQGRTYRRLEILRVY